MFRPEVGLTNYPVTQGRMKGRSMEDYLSEISVQDLKRRLDKGEEIFLLDVREPYEFKIANLQGLLLPLGQLHQKVGELDRNREIVVYCHHGNRSGIAVQFLKNQGFERVLNLAGGIDRWSREIDPKVPRY
jgi:sulfur-carrier protein adenylyltransferase/sulfurtransferase